MLRLGYLRLGSGVVLISENGFIYFHDRDGPWGGPFFAAPAVGVRLFGSEFAVDLALVGIVTGRGFVTSARKSCDRLQTLRRVTASPYARNRVDAGAACSGGAMAFLLQ